MTGPERLFADGYMAVLGIQAGVWEDGRRVRMLLQPVTGYLRLAQVFVWGSALREGVNF